MNRQEARKKAEALVAQMTLEEAAGQLSYQAPAIERLGVPAYNWWNEALHGVARAGMATMFPQAIGLGAMFDPDLLQQLGDVAATEGRAKYNAAFRHGELMAGAVFAVNCVGDILENGEIIAGVRRNGGLELCGSEEAILSGYAAEKDLFKGNTVIGCIFTDDCTYIIHPDGSPLIAYDHIEKTDIGGAQFTRDSRVNAGGTIRRG